MDSQFDYQRSLGALSFSPDEKAGMTARLIKASSSARGQRPARRPIRRMVLAVSAAAVLLTIGAGAAVLHLAGEYLTPVFGAAETEIIDRIGRPIDASATSAGLTISADAIIGDRYNACVVYTIARDDGAPLGLPEDLSVSSLTFDEFGCDLSGGDGGHGTAWFTDSDPSDTTIQFVETVSAAGALEQGPTAARFRTLHYLDPISGQQVTVADGDWKLRFEVRYEDVSTPLPTGQTFSRDGLDFTVTELSLSPVALRVSYRASGQMDLGDDASQEGRMSASAVQETSRYLGGIPLLVTKTDGSTLDLTDAGGGVSPDGDGSLCYKGGVFHEILPLEDVASITVGDVVIPVHAVSGNLAP